MFKSGEWLGHSSEFTLWSVSHFFVDFAACMLRVIHYLVAGPILLEDLALILQHANFCSKYLDTSQHSSYHLLPVFFQFHLQRNIPKPPPNFTVGIVFFGARAVTSFLQTWFLELRSNNPIFVSSYHRTLSQNDSCSVMWSEANFSRATLCRLVKSGVFLGERDFSSFPLSLLLIIRNTSTWCW